MTASIINTNTHSSSTSSSSLNRQCDTDVNNNAINQNKGTDQEKAPVKDQDETDNQTLLHSFRIRDKLTLQASTLDHEPSRTRMSFNQLFIITVSPILSFVFF